jgi:hypothetical protein
VKVTFNALTLGHALSAFHVVCLVHISLSFAISLSIEFCSVESQSKCLFLGKVTSPYITLLELSLIVTYSFCETDIATISPHIMITLAF